MYSAMLMVTLAAGAESPQWGCYYGGYGYGCCTPYYSTWCNPYSSWGYGWNYYPSYSYAPAVGVAPVAALPAVPAAPAVVPTLTKPAPTFVAPAPRDPSITPLNDAEREAVRRVLDLMRKKTKQVPKDPNVATIVVSLPTDAKLYVDNVLCTLTSGTRSFDTPSLEQGREYFYTLRLEGTRDGQAITESRRVRLAAGQRVDVDFNLPVAAAAR